MQSLLENLHGRRYHGVAVDAELLQLLQASKGVREGCDLVVADVQFHEGEEEAYGVRQSVKVLEVLADVENFEVDKVLEVFGEGPEAIKPGI